MGPFKRCTILVFFLGFHYCVWMFSEWFPDFSLRMKICLLNPIKNVKSRKGLRYDWVHRSCLKLFFGSLKGQTLNSRHCVPGSFKMVKNRAEKTSVFYISNFHMKTAPPMNTFDFLKY